MLIFEIVMLVSVVVMCFANFRMLMGAEKQFEEARDMHRIAVERSQATRKMIEEHTKELARQRLGGDA